MKRLNFYKRSRFSDIRKPDLHNWLSVRGVMALWTQAYQITRIVIEFILINVMNVKIVSPALAGFSASLTRPFVSIANNSSDSFPVGGIVPFSNTTFPGGVVFSRNFAGKDKGFGLRATLYVMLFKPFYYGASAYIKLFSYINRSSFFDDIFVFEPFLIMKYSLWSIMPSYVFKPIATFVLSWVPLDTVTTPASAKGRRGIFRRYINNWSAPFSIRHIFFWSSDFYAMLFKMVQNCWRSYAKFFRNSFGTYPGSIWGSSGISPNRPFDVGLGKLRVISAPSAFCNSVFLQYAINSCAAFANYFSYFRLCKVFPVFLFGKVKSLYLLNINSTHAVNYTIMNKELPVCAY